jgi:hypothetical protein
VTNESNPLRTELARIGTDDALIALDKSRPARERLRPALLALAAGRGGGSSTCPSDAARAVGGADWRELMDAARAAARALARSGLVEITQRGAVLAPDAEWHGPIRVRLRS